MEAWYRIDYDTEDALGNEFKRQLLIDSISCQEAGQKAQDYLKSVLTEPHSIQVGFNQWFEIVKITKTKIEVLDKAVRKA